MAGIIIRQVSKDDLDGCCDVENACYTTEGATREKIKKRIEIYPEGFLVAELEGRIVGIINSGSTNKEDITDEKFKDMVGHDTNGKNIVIFSLAVLPEFQKKGISKMLMREFINASKRLGKEKILLLCKENLMPYYKKFGFFHLTLSKSKHGGLKWHEMCLPIV